MRAFISICAGLAFAACCHAATPAHYSRRIWRIEDGLPQAKIQSFAQTPDGYLWIGTSGGLVRFDGARFTIFDRTNTPELRDDSIMSLLCARDGSLWIGTEGGGLAHLQKGTFRAYGAAEGLTNGFVRVFLEDSHQRLWVGTDRGFFRFVNGGFRRLDRRGAVPNLAAHAVLEDSAGTIWAGTSYGMFRMEGDSMVKSPDGTDGIGDITGLFETAQHDLLVASARGLYRVSGGRLVNDPRVNAINARRIYRDRDGNAWVSIARAGLIRLRAGSMEQTASLTAPDPLPDSSVLAVFEDSQRNLWVGTNDGILRLTETTVRTYNSSDGLAEDNVMSVYCDPAGKIWLATASGILYSMEAGHPVRFRQPALAPNFPARNIYVTRTGEQWMGSSTYGALRLDAHGAKLFNMNTGFRSNGIRDFLQVRDGSMWFATGSGVSHWDGVAAKTLYLEDGLAYGGVRVLAEDPKGDLLVGSDGGVNRVHGNRIVPDALLQKVGNHKVWTILADADGTIWLGTRGDGLMRVRGNNVVSFGTPQGLPSNAIYKILDDGAGSLWMSSAAGVFSVRRSDLNALAEGKAPALAVIPFDTDDGMLSSQMNGGVQSAGARDAEGNLWFASVKGAVKIDPTHIRTMPAAPVIIEGLLVDQKSKPLSGPLSIAPGGNRIEIDFAAPNLAAPDRVNFRYMLEGFETTWNPSFRRRAAYYTNLPPRHYRFRVVATDGGQPNRTTEASLAFEMLPHFYETFWFYGLIALSIALAVYAGFRFYARQTRARYALVLAERTRLAREMHDTVIQGCVGVSTLLEAVRSMPPSAELKQKDLIERAARQIRSTVNEAREAVWDLRHSAIEHGLAGTLRQFAQQVSASEGIEVNVEIAGTPAAVDEAVGRNLLLVAREAVRNAIMHGAARHIGVKLHFEPSIVLLEVIDDGRGFPLAQPQSDGHYGIVGMRERVEQSGGRFELHSEPGSGTSVTARLPLGRSNHKKYARA